MDDDDDDIAASLMKAFTTLFAKLAHHKMIGEIASRVTFSQMKSKFQCGPLVRSTGDGNEKAVCRYLSGSWTSIWATEANVVQQLTAHLRQATAAQHWLLWPKCSSMFRTFAGYLELPRVGSTA